MSEVIRAEDHVRPPRVAAESATSFAGQIATAAPEDLGPDALKALKAVERVAGEIAGVISARELVAPARVRPTMNVVVGAWTSLGSTLEVKAALPSDLSRTADDARELHTKLFPEGVPFVAVDALTVHGGSMRLIARVDDEGLEPEIERLAGPEFMPVIRKSTKALGEMIGARGTKREVPSTTALQDALAKFGRAISAYVVALLAETDLEDPTSVARFLSAIAPIEAQRQPARAAASDAANGAAQPAAATTSSAGEHAVPTTSSVGEIAAPTKAA